MSDHLARNDHAGAGRTHPPPDGIYQARAKKKSSSPIILDEDNGLSVKDTIAEKSDFPCK